MTHHSPITVSIANNDEERENQHQKCTMTKALLNSAVRNGCHVDSGTVRPTASAGSANGTHDYQWSVNICVNVSGVSDEDAANINNWWALLALVLVLGTAAGNILVCLAITWERRLQNVTNYFLMSLAITDLMVAVLVMPLGILTLVRGKNYTPGNTLLGILKSYFDC